MIKQRRQRIRYVMIGHDGDLIGDAEVKLHKIIIEIKPAKHDTGADKELVSASTQAARPLSVVESEFRPEVLTNMILQGHAGEETFADVVLFVLWERIAYRSLDIEITPADAACDCGGDDPSRSVGEGGDAGWRLKSQKSTENIVSIFFIGAKQPLFDGDEVPICETRCGLDLASL